MAGTITGPAAGGATTVAPRDLIRSVHLGNYHEETHVELAGTLAAATLVSSRRSDGTHSPALDIDHRAAITVDAAGDHTLWVSPAATNARRWRKLHQSGIVAGIFRPGDIPIDADARRCAWEQARHSCRDVGAITETVVALGENSDMNSFDDLLAAANLIEYAPVTCDLDDPWPLPLAHHATLLSSTSNVHLYIDCSLGWDTYRTVLRRLAAAGVIERGYYHASKDRRHTRLRVPWVRKPAPFE